MLRTRGLVVYKLIANTRTGTTRFDLERYDVYERTLAYVWISGGLFNKVVVRQGYAWPEEYPPNTKESHALARAEKSARLRHSAEGGSAWLDTVLHAVRLDSRRAHERASWYLLISSRECQLY